MVYVILILGIVIVDALVKAKMQRRKLGEQQEILKGRLILCNTRNYGLAFGYLEKLKKGTKVLVAFILAGCGLAWFKVNKDGHEKLKKLSYSLLLGGGISNFYDRIKRGYVVDYLIFPVKHKKLGRTVFNLSDLFIFAGAIGLVLVELVEKFKGKK